MDLIQAFGHANILATHKTTIELTREDFLTRKGDCIIGIKANKTSRDLDKKLKDELNEGQRLRIILECNGIKDSLTGYGDKRLTLNNPTSIVIRKSDFICSRTLCIKADKAAADLDRKLIKELKDGGKLTATLEIVH